jgi:hypothetical protein
MFLILYSQNTSNIYRQTRPAAWQGDQGFYAPSLLWAGKGCSCGALRLGWALFLYRRLFLVFHPKHAGVPDRGHSPSHTHHVCPVPVALRLADALLLVVLRRGEVPVPQLRRLALHLRVGAGAFRV